MKKKKETAQPCFAFQHMTVEPKRAILNTSVQHSSLALKSKKNARAYTAYTKSNALGQYCASTRVKMESFRKNKFAKAVNKHQNNLKQ